MIHSLTFSWRNTSARRKSRSACSMGPGGPNDARNTDTQKDPAISQKQVQHDDSTSATTTTTKPRNSALNSLRSSLVSLKSQKSSSNGSNKDNARIYLIPVETAPNPLAGEASPKREGSRRSLSTLKSLSQFDFDNDNSTSYYNLQEYSYNQHHRHHHKKGKGKAKATLIQASTEDTNTKEVSDNSRTKNPRNMVSPENRISLQENAERLVSVYHPVFCQFTGIAFDSQRSANDAGVNNKARQKLIKLSKLHFLELCTDVYDELQRRVLQDQDQNAPSALEARDDIHPKRNQARQRLAVLSTTRFNDLATDILFEIERRFPNVRSIYHNTTVGSDNNSVYSANRQSFQHQQQQQQPHPNANRFSYEVHDEDAYRNRLSSQSQDQQPVPPTGIVVTNPQEEQLDTRTFSDTYENIVSPPPIPEDDSETTASGEKKRTAKSMAFISPTLPELDFSGESPALSVDARNSVASSRYDEDFNSTTGTPSQAFERGAVDYSSPAAHPSAGPHPSNSSTVAQSLRGNVIIPQKSTLVEEDVEDDEDEDDVDHDGFGDHDKSAQNRSGSIYSEDIEGQYNKEQIKEPSNIEREIQNLENKSETTSADADAALKHTTIDSGLNAPVESDQATAREEELQRSFDDSKYFNAPDETLDAHDQERYLNDQLGTSTPVPAAETFDDNKRASIATQSAYGDDNTDYASLDGDGEVNSHRDSLEPKYQDQEEVRENDQVQEQEQVTRGIVEEPVRRMSKRVSLYDNNMLDSITEEESGVSDINTGETRALPTVSHSKPSQSGSKDEILKEKQAQLDRLVQENARLEDAVQKLEVQFDESEVLKTTLMKENEQLHLMVSDLESQRQQVNEEIATLQEQIKSHQVDNENLKAQVEAIPEYETKVRAISDSHATTLASLTADHENKIKELSDSHAKELNEHKANHESYINDLTSQHEQYIAELTAKHELSLKDAHEQTARELSEQHEAKLTDLIGQHDTRLNDLSTEHERTVKELVEKHEAEKQELLLQIENLKRQLGSNDQVQPHLDRISELEASNTELQGHLSTLKERHADALNKQNGYAEESAALSNEIMLLQSKVSHYESRDLSLDGANNNGDDKQVASSEHAELKSKYEDLKRDHLTLTKELEHQQKVTEQVQREASEFLEEMRHLVENKKALDSAESLANQVQALKLEAHEWKTRYSRAKNQLRNIRASGYGTSNSIFQTTVIPNPNESPFTDPNGLVRDVTVSKFQLAMDEFLMSTRASSSQESFHYLHNVVVSTRAIAQELSDNNSATNENMQSSIAQANSLVSSIANQLITVTRNYTTSGGLSPLSVVDSAASDLAFAVIDLLKLVKIRSTNDKLDLSPSLAGSVANSPTKNKRISFHHSSSSSPEKPAAVKPNGTTPATNMPHTVPFAKDNIPTPASREASYSKNQRLSSSETRKPLEIQTQFQGQGQSQPQFQPQTQVQSQAQAQAQKPISPLSPGKQRIQSQTRSVSNNSISSNLTNSSRNNVVSPVRYSSQLKSDNSADISIGFDAEDPDNTVAELQAYLERKTVDAVDSIQNLLTGIRKDVQLKSLLPHMDNVVNVANSMIEATGNSMRQTRNWLLKDKGGYILQNLEDCSARLAILYEDLEHASLDAELDRQFRQRIAGVSFDMAKCTKELVKTVEEVSLTSEIQHIDSQLGL